MQNPLHAASNPKMSAAVDHALPIPSKTRLTGMTKGSTSFFRSSCLPEQTQQPHPDHSLRNRQSRDRLLFTSNFRHMTRGDPMFDPAGFLRSSTLKDTDLIFFPPPSHPSSLFFRSSLASFGFAFPRVSLITCPTRKPNTFPFPFR